MWSPEILRAVEYVNIRMLFFKGFMKVLKGVFALNLTFDSV
jgi:hypothetical protein